MLLLETYAAVSSCGGSSSPSSRNTSSAFSFHAPTHSSVAVLEVQVQTTFRGSGPRLGLEGIFTGCGRTGDL